MSLGYTLWRRENDHDLVTDDLAFLVAITAALTDSLD